MQPKIKAWGREFPFWATAASLVQLPGEAAPCPGTEGGPFRLPSQQQAGTQGEHKIPIVKTATLVRKMGNGKNELQQQKGAPKLQQKTTT